MNEELGIHDADSDAPDWQYWLAGQLLGTDWQFPEQGVDTIGQVKSNTTREQGQKFTSPEVVLKYAGTRLPVSGFLRRIDPNDIADIDPADKTAERIVDIHQSHSWRSLEMSPESSTEWRFGDGDIIREEEEQFAPGGVELGKSEYRIKWRLNRQSDGDRCYLVEKEEGGTHLYTAGAIEPLFETIPASQSRAFSETAEDGDAR
jgi:hypothetical protein